MTGSIPRTVLVPDDVGLTALADRAGIRPVRYDPDLPSQPRGGCWPTAGRDAEVLVVWNHRPERVLAALPELANLRLVQTLTSGVDTWRGRLPAGVRLANTRGAGGAATAEWALAALLAMVRELPHFLSRQAGRQWDYRQTSTLIGARVLVIGAGDVGSHLHHYLTALGSRTTLVGRTRRPGVAGFPELPGLLGEQDAVVLAVPLDQTTRRLVDSTFLASMRDGAVLVNASRGAVVDTDALVAELVTDRLRAALDVTDPEPLPAGHPLWDCPGLLITPHVATATPGESLRAWAVAAEQIAVQLAGGDPANLV
jgi:phosphoglycerate dehydrogenase-like enzyme